MMRIDSGLPAAAGVEAGGSGEEEQGGGSRLGDGGVSEQDLVVC